MLGSFLRLSFLFSLLIFSGSTFNLSMSSLKRLQELSLPPESGSKEVCRAERLKTMVWWGGSSISYVQHRLLWPLLSAGSTLQDLLPTFVCFHRNSKLSVSIFAQYSHVNSYSRASEPRTFKIDGIIPMRRSGSRSLGSGFLGHQANSVDKADDALNSKMQRTTGRKGTAMPTVRSLNGGSIVCDNPREASLYDFHISCAPLTSFSAVIL